VCSPVYVYLETWLGYDADTVPIAADVFGVCKVGVGDRTPLPSLRDLVTITSFSGFP
jgi:hypothetical protein